MQSNDKNSPVVRYPSHFEGSGKLEGEYCIQLEGEKPFMMSVVPHRVAIPLMQPVKDELARVMEHGVIKRVNETTDCCAGTVVPPNSDKRFVYVLIALTSTRVSTERGILSGRGATTSSTRWCSGVLDSGCELRVLADTT